MENPLEREMKRMTRRILPPAPPAVPDAGVRSMSRAVAKQMRGGMMADGSPPHEPPSAPQGDTFADALARHQARQQAITLPPRGPVQDVPALWKARARRGQTVPGGVVTGSVPTKEDRPMDLPGAIIACQTSSAYSPSPEGLVSEIRKRYPELLPASLTREEAIARICQVYKVPTTISALPRPAAGSKASQEQWYRQRFQGANQGQGFSHNPPSRYSHEELVRAYLGKGGPAAVRATEEWEKAMLPPSGAPQMSKQRAAEVAGLLMTRRPSRIHAQLHRAGFPLSATVVQDVPPLLEGSDLEREVLEALERVGPLSDVQLCEIIAAMLAKHLRDNDPNETLRLQKDIQPHRPTRPVSTIVAEQPPGAHISMALSVTPADRPMAEARRQHLAALQTKRLPPAVPPPNYSRRWTAPQNR